MSFCERLRQLLPSQRALPGTREAGTGGFDDEFHSADDSSRDLRRGSGVKTSKDHGGDRYKSDANARRGIRRARGRAASARDDLLALPRHAPSLLLHPRLETALLARRWW